MTEQLNLVEVAAAARPPTGRQQLALAYVGAHDGVTADEVGAWLHAHKPRRPHPADVRCDWCAQDGLGVLRSKAVAPLVTYRRAGGGRLYILRDRAASSPAEPAPAERVSHRIADDPFAGL